MENRGTSQGDLGKFYTSEDIFHSRHRLRIKHNSHSCSQRGERETHEDLGYLEEVSWQTGN